VRIRLMLSAFFVLPAMLCAQGPPGTNVRVAITVSSLTRAGDTVSIAYRIANRRESAEPVSTFYVETPSPAIRVTLPGPTTIWFASDSIADYPIVSWSALDTALIGAGKTSPDLSFSAIGIPGIVDAHVEGYYPPPELIEDSLVAEPDFLTTLKTHAIHVRVVGVHVLDKSLGAAAFITRLETLRAESCTLGWVSNTGICQSIRAKLDAALAAVQRGQGSVASNQLKALLNEVDAQRGKQVNDSAFHLLRANVEYILTRL